LGTNNLAIVLAISCQIIVIRISFNYNARILRESEISLQWMETLEKRWWTFDGEPMERKKLALTR